MSTGLIMEDRGNGAPLDFLTSCVTIPYHVANNVITIRGRSLVPDSKAKYKTLAGAKARLFNSDATWHATELFVAEGEFGCLLLEQLGYAAIGVPGAASWQDQWDGYLSLVDHVYLVFDGDEAGRKGSQRLKDRFGAKVRALEIPEEDGEVPDITDWVVRYGRTTRSTNPVRPRPDRATSCDRPLVGPNTSLCEPPTPPTDRPTVGPDCAAPCARARGLWRARPGTDPYAFRLAPRGRAPRWRLGLRYNGLAGTDRRSRWAWDATRLPPSLQRWHLGGGRRRPVV